MEENDKIQLFVNGVVEFRWMQAKGLDWWEVMGAILVDSATKSQL